MYPLRMGPPFTSPLRSDSPLKTPLNPEAPFIYPFPLPSPEFLSVPTFVSDYCHHLYLRSVRIHSGSSTAPFLFLRRCKKIEFGKDTGAYINQILLEKITKSLCSCCNFNRHLDHLYIFENSHLRKKFNKEKKKIATKINQLAN
ncbi:hypothetical protein BpHYR1_044608 [Brachionus plicatilis]|uniref:Uncharacterized protein n=1 Tax=Brachionus plicatilis TaxID=10195 RepID=A0A3M7PS22_BRAPC|nr:hypothetical protein BpHYR1_044608 [Brachionus plicatilis]